MDPRIKELSALLTGYSCRLQAGEKVLIDYEGEDTKPLVRQLIKDAYQRGARPYVNHRDSQVLRELLLGAEEEQLTFLNDYQLAEIVQMKSSECGRWCVGKRRILDIEITVEMKIEFFVHSDHSFR